MISRNCLKCGREFKTRPSFLKKNKGRYCSHSCSSSAIPRRKGTKNKVKIGVIEKCFVCNKEFYKRPCNIKMGNKNHCSIKCSSITGAKKRRKSPKFLNCINCNELFLNGHSINKGFCSKKCSGINHRSKFIKSCIICQKDFFANPKKVSNGNDKFCSRECNGKFRSINFVDDKHPGWKGSEVGYSGLHRWVAKKLGKPNQCEHCGKIVTKMRHIHWANKSQEYKRDLTDWLRLCAICHIKYDKEYRLSNNLIKIRS